MTQTISPERRLELAKKYGVDQSVVKAIEANSAHWEQLQEETNIFEHAIINNLIHTADIEEVALLLSLRFGLSDDQYSQLLTLAHDQSLEETDRRWQLSLILRPGDSIDL